MEIRLLIIRSRSDVACTRPLQAEQHCIPHCLASRSRLVQDETVAYIVAPAAACEAESAVGMQELKAIVESSPRKVDLWRMDCSSPSVHLDDEASPACMHVKDPQRKQGGEMGGQFIYYWTFGVDAETAWKCAPLLCNPGLQAPRAPGLADAVAWPAHGVSRAAGCSDVSDARSDELELHGWSPCRSPASH